MNHKIIISESRFVELYSKAEDTDRICRECRDDHAALIRARDELLAFVIEVRGALYDHDIHDWERRADALVAKYAEEDAK